MKHHKGIDALRGLAVLSVMVFHFYHVLGFGSLALFPHVQYLGQFGVSLFFVISGYLIYGSFVNLHKEHSLKKSLKIYWLNRFFRIVPAYYFSLFIVILLASATITTSYLYSIGFLEQVISHLTFSSYFVFRSVGFGFNGAYWTLNVELLWYALAPLIVVFAKRDLMIAFGMVFSFFLLGVLDWVKINGLIGYEPKYNVILYYLSFQIFPQFIYFGAGVLIYKNREIIIPKLPNYTSWLIILLFTLFMYMSPVTIDSFVIRNLVLLLITSTLFLLALNSRKVEYAIFPWIGKISYSLYLWHFPVLVVMKNSGATNALSFSSVFLVYGFSVLLISSMSYYLIEVSALRFKPSR